MESIKKIDRYFKAFKIKKASDIDLKELQRRYRILAQKYHPDKGGTNAQFTFITDAYNYLKDRITEYLEKESKKFYNAENLIFYGNGSIFSKTLNRWVKFKGKKIKNQ